jgi:uncharacterized DUF497 family protein
VEIAASAYRHSVSAEDIVHAWRNPVHVVPIEYNGEERLLVIGPRHSGDLLELVAIPADNPTRIIHADRLQPSRYDYLR